MTGSIKGVVIIKFCLQGEVIFCHRFTDYERLICESVAKSTIAIEPAVCWSGDRQRRNCASDLRALEISV